jgi:hypothetical protein
MTPRPSRVAALLLVMLLAACTSGGSGATPVPTGPPASDAAGTCPATPAPDQASIPQWSAASQHPTLFPYPITSSGAIACGPTRFQFSFLTADTMPVAAPDRTATVAFYDLGADPSTPVMSAEGTFIWGIEDVTGVYVVDVDFPSSGLWGAEFTTEAPGSPAETIRMQFDVQSEPVVVSVGDPAPPSDTPTLADVGGDVTKISTDDDPVDAFYQTSVADAVAAGKPFLLVFATPKFCASAQCGPTLDRVKPIAAAHPGLTVINVEPYELNEVDGQLQPVTQGDPPRLVNVPATEEWRLLSEPWIFAVGSGGIVTASLEGIASSEEIEAAVATIE